MKTRNRVFAIFALLFNILILGSTSYGIFLAIMDAAPDYLELLKYFTIDSNLLLAVASLMMLPCNIVKIAKPEKPYVPFFKNLKFAAAVSTTITLVIAYGFLATIEMLHGGSYLNVVLGDINNYPIYTRMEFFLHTLAPALAIISVIFDKDTRAKYKVVTYGFIPLAVYAIPYIAFAVVPGLKSVYGGDWYGFLNFSLIPSNDLLNTVALSAIALVGMFLVALLFGTILWALSLIGASDGNKTERVTYRYVGPVEEPESPSEPAQEEQQVEQEQPIEEPAPVVAPIQEEVQPEESNEQPIEEPTEEESSKEATQTDHDPEEESGDEVTEEPQPEDEEPTEEVQEEVEDEEPIVEQVSEPEEIEENQQEPEQNEPVTEEKVEPEEVAPAPVIDEKTPEEPVQEEPKEEKKILWNFQKVKAKPKKGFAKKEPSEKKEPETKPAAKAAPKKETKTTTNKTKNKGGTKVAAAKKEVAKKEAPKKEAPKKAAKKEEPAKFNGKARVYHISQHENGYKVKLAGGEKAIKTFKTQKEAIAYAKELVKTQGGTYLIHSLDGSIRKG